MGQNIHAPRVFISSNEKQGDEYVISGNLSNNSSTPTNLHSHNVFDDAHSNGLSPPHPSGQAPLIIVGGSSSGSSSGGDEIVSSPFHSPRSPKFVRNHDDVIFDNLSDSSYSTSPQNSPKLTSRTKRMSSGPNYSPKLENFRKTQQQQTKQPTVWFSSVSNESDWMDHSNRFAHTKKQKMVLMLSYGVNTHSEDLFQYWFQRFLPKSEETQTKSKIMQLCALYLRRLCFAYVNRSCSSQLIQECSTSTCSNEGVDQMVDYSKTLKRFDSWSLSPLTREETFSHDDFINELIDMLVNNDESFILQSLGHWNANILTNMELLWKSEAIQRAASKLVEQQVYMDEKVYAEYFLNSIPHLLDSSYNLTVSDLSNAQRRKFKINEIKIVDQGNYDCLYSVLDISSMGGEKTKWLRSFNNVDGFLMIFSLDEIAQDKSVLQKSLHSFREMTSYFFGNNQQQNGCKTQIYVCFSNVAEFCKLVKSEELPLQHSLKGDVKNPSIVFKYIVSQFMASNGSCSNNLTERNPTSSQNISFYAIDSFSDYYSMYEFTSYLLEGRNYFSELITGAKEKREVSRRGELFSMCKLSHDDKLKRKLIDISFNFE
ncbi:predicted protein [Naegleria gruberi]|uniref:Predicted protein n=1 Tax=Naegleria gruberi TaxID=5762 RepID=D2VP44_NAEGR|nr:uncharacterized protein NAEGRDRAFT_70726 [Naegleria gruberi]EFC41293.1 predicted protein [Naegleria gruberi]|eukprot:XP_002674037.1 predicted protein [Naegleria gruberi strain NEG-M]